MNRGALSQIRDRCGVILRGEAQPRENDVLTRSGRIIPLIRALFRLKLFAVVTVVLLLSVWLTAPWLRLFGMRVRAALWVSRLFRMWARVVMAA